MIGQTGGMAERVVLSNGELRTETGAAIDASALIGPQAAAIDDATTEHALNSTFSDTEVEAALDALGTTVNSVLAALRDLGVIAGS